MSVLMKKTHMILFLIQEECTIKSYNLELKNSFVSNKLLLLWGSNLNMLWLEGKEG